MSILQRGETESAHAFHIPTPARVRHGVPNISSKARSTAQRECIHLRHSALKHRKLIGLGQHKQHVVARGRHGKQEAIAS
jgi:hypothetical protein